MFDLKLFMGFAPDEMFQKKIAATNPYLVSLFIGREEYLQEISHQEKRFIGKYLPSFPTLDQLEDTHKHLLSLLNRLAPGYSFSHNPPIVLTLSLK